jgi:hypothetical protein
LVDSLLKYARQERYFSIFSNEHIHDDEIHLSRLKLYYDLVDNYLKNGLYTQIRLVRRKNSGKADWKNTIANVKPLIGFNGVPVYPEFIANFGRNNFESHITKIQAQIIREIHSIFGESLFGTADNSAVISLLNIPDLNLSSEEKVRILQSEMNQTYRDSDILLLKNMIYYLGDFATPYCDAAPIGMKTFSSVWEEMLRDTLKDVVSVNDVLPRPYYVLSDNSESKAKGMVTDIVIKRFNTVHVLDAKYYSANSVAGAPSWSDLVKQFFYAKALSSVFPDSDVYNWFIFPGAESDGLNGPLASVVIKDPLNGILLDKDFPPIFCIYINPLKLIHFYVNNLKFDDCFIESSFLSRCK